MSKHLIHTAHADQRAIKFYFALREIEKMPMIGIQFAKDGKKIVLFDRVDSQKLRECSVGVVLGFNPKKAMENGGSLDALMDSYQRPQHPTPRNIVEEETHLFLQGDE
jgi:hypothetical protein